MGLSGNHPDRLITECNVRRVHTSLAAAYRDAFLCTSIGGVDDMRANSMTKRPGVARVRTESAQGNKERAKKHLGNGQESTTSEPALPST
ncbi:hypothetical protein GCM10023199_17950 [Actinomycetospora chibensis]